MGMKQTTYRRGRVFDVPPIQIVAGHPGTPRLCQAVIVVTCPTNFGVSTPWSCGWLLQRQTALVAKQAAAVDVLSAGRLRLGVGVGWNAVEFEALGENFKNRGKRIEEQIGVKRALWPKEWLRLEGQWYRIPGAGINPLPNRRPIPIWMGGENDAVVKRAARLADGWMPHVRPGEEAQAVVDRLHAAVREAGRDPARFGIEGRMALPLVPPSLRTGELAAWRTMRGVTHLCIPTVGLGLKTPGEHVEALEDFKKDVIG